ncbi:MAG: DUF5615 family PIN-like protein [Dehalococcoidia bacterium]
MRLLLDEMWPPTIADALRLRGYDVVAVAERLDLRSRPDEEIFAVAQSEGRVIFTENAPDFHNLVVASMEADRPFAGAIFTSNRRFPRSDDRTPGRVVNALARLLDEDTELASQEHWLQ